MGKLKELYDMSLYDICKNIHIWWHILGTPTIFILNTITFQYQYFRQYDSSDTYFVRECRIPRRKCNNSTFQTAQSSSRQGLIFLSDQILSNDLVMGMLIITIKINYLFSGDDSSKKVNMSDYELRGPSHVRDISNIVNKLLYLHKKVVT